VRRHPLLYQINTRAYLTRVGATLERQATLDDFPDADIDAIAARGFDWIWLLSVWQLGDAGRRVALENPGWRAGYQAALPDLTDDDIQSSGFAIVRYRVADDLGGPESLARLRERFAERGLLLMLDFVPNHMALDADWVYDRPNYFITGTSAALACAPQNYQLIATARGTMILAHGRDPNFDGWPDTLQLDYSNPALQAAQRATLLDIARQCDGVRCDMAMLLLPDVFARTWGLRPEPFWPAAIAGVRARFPSFVFMAEAYWDLEAAMQEQGFDYAYDKRLYDRLRAESGPPVRDHLAGASFAYQAKLARFLENHDEPRAASVFTPPVEEAAAVITFCAPGMRFFYAGQLEGAKVRLPTPLVREPIEPVDECLAAFYSRLLAVLKLPVLHDGGWAYVDAYAAWQGNGTFANFVAFAWEDAEQRVLAIVNYGATQAQCYVRLPFAGLARSDVHLADLLGSERYVRDGSTLQDPGLYVDLPPWRYNVFEFTTGR
jgi:hypothetical protein